MKTAGISEICHIYGIEEINTKIYITCELFSFETFSWTNTNIHTRARALHIHIYWYTHTFRRSVYIYIYIYIYIRGEFNKFPDFFVQIFKIVVDSWKFTILLLYILWDDRPIFIISDSNEQIQQQLEYTQQRPDCHRHFRRTICNKIPF